MRFYRRLLHLFPSSFRNEYGPEMCAVFERKRRDVPNVAGLLALWLETLADVLTSAGAVHFDILRQDLRYSLRTLARTPGFTVTAIIVAALGIGATTAAFTMMDHVLIRPLPFRDQDRIVKLWENHAANGAHGELWDISPANFRDWKNMSKSFESMAAYRALSVNMIGEGEPSRIDGASVTGEMFATLGVHPYLGRFITPDDDRESAPGTVVLSYSLWQAMFAGDAGVVGRKIVLDGSPYTVIGVMPSSFYFPNREALLWTAMRFAARDFEHRTNTYIYGIAKLKPGVPVERAQAEMRAIAGQLARAYPRELARTGATVRLMRDQVSRQTMLMLQALLGAAGCVLLVACTNLANLLVARALSRRKELAVRAAIGAGRERLVRQVLTESLTLALAGGGLGLAIAYWALPLLARLVPVTLPIAEVPSIDLRVLAFAVTVTIATGIAFGVIPAFRVCKRKDSADLREGNRSGIGGRHEGLRSALVVAEIAGSIVLLVSCGLLLRALWRVQAVDPGFRTEHILTLRTSLPQPKYDSRTAREAFYHHVLDAARALPGVTGAAYISFLPMGMRGGLWPVEIAGAPLDIAERQDASLRFVTPGFFAVLQIPLLAGRDVSENDTFERPFVAVVSESFVRRYFPDRDALGRHFNFGDYDRTIVGVVGDIRVRGLEQTSEPQVYLPYQQHDRVAHWFAPKDLVIASGSDPRSLMPALRRIIHDADAEQPISDVRTLSEIVAAETASRALEVGVLGSFALMTFLLAAIGIHGLLSFSVSSRTQEIGVRIALGADGARILGMVMREGVALAAAGTAAGVALAYAAARLLNSLLAGVSPNDLGTFTAAVLLTVLMTLAGSALPVLRALKIDPTTAIRG